LSVKCETRSTIGVFQYTMSSLKKTHHHRDLSTHNPHPVQLHRHVRAHTAPINRNPWRGAVKHISHDSSWAGGSDTDEFDADDVVVVCRCCNLTFLRLVAAAAVIFCWAQCLCVCAHGMAHS